MTATEFDELYDLVMEDQDASAAAVENSIRRNLAKHVEQARFVRGWSLRKLADELGTSLSQVQRITHREVGGGLTIGALVRVARLFGWRLVIRFEEIGS